MRSDLVWIIRDASTGYPPPGIPSYRSYPSEEKARRAAIRAARTHGRAIAWGRGRHVGLGEIVVKQVAGEIPAPVQS